MTQRAPTIKDVAELANVHHSTASRALRGSAEIHVDTVLRVRAAAAELGYVPNFHAQAMRSQEPRSLVAVVTDSSSIGEFSRTAQPFWLAMLMGMTHYLAVSGVGAVQLGTEALDILDAIHPRALVLLSIVDAPFELPERVRSRPLIVDAHHYLAPNAAVTIGHNHGQIAQDACDYMRDRGATNIAYLPLSGRDNLSVAAAAGYRTWCASHNQEPVVIEPKAAHEDARQAVSDAVSAGVDGIYATTGQLLALQQGITAGKRRCPEDVQIVCIGEGVQELLLTPSLTSVNLHGDRCARAIAELLIRIVGNEPYTNVEFEYELVPRGSTRA